METEAEIEIDLDPLTAEIRKAVHAMKSARLMARYDTLTHALCELYGPKPGCWCKGNRENCHADRVWRKEGTALTIALERQELIDNSVKNALVQALEAPLLITLVSSDVSESLPPASPEPAQPASQEPPQADSSAPQSSPALLQQPT